MKSVLRIGLMGVVFTLGCFTASVVQQIAVPTLQANSTATKWEQTCVHGKSQGIDVDGGFGTSNHSASSLNNPEFKDWGDVVKEWGAQGWELIQITNNQQFHIIYACFKRPM